MNINRYCTLNIRNLMYASMIDYRYWKMMQLQFLNGWDDGSSSSCMSTTPTPLNVLRITKVCPIRFFKWTRQRFKQNFSYCPRMQRWAGWWTKLKYMEQLVVDQNGSRPSQTTLELMNNCVTVLNYNYIPSF